MRNASCRHASPLRSRVVWALGVILMCHPTTTVLAQGISKGMGAFARNAEDIVGAGRSSRLGAGGNSLLSTFGQKADDFARRIGQHGGTPPRGPIASGTTHNDIPLPKRFRENAAEITGSRQRLLKQFNESSADITRRIGSPSGTRPKGSGGSGTPGSSHTPKPKPRGP